MFDRCDGCTSPDYCPIPTDGPVESKVWCYGERPGQQEEYNARKWAKIGSWPDEPRCFIGDAGREYNENYLPLAGLSRYVVRCGNVVMCGKKSNRKPTSEDIRRCAEYHITKDLAQGTPEVIILMGASACELVPGIELAAHHGIPRHAEILGWSGWCVPMYHPAAGLHDTRMIQPMLEDWGKLGSWLNTNRAYWQWAFDTRLEFKYMLAKTANDVHQYFGNYRYDTWLTGVDTETQNNKPYSIQVSVRPGTGILVLVENQEALEALVLELQLLVSFGAEFILHNSPADLPILVGLGVDGIKYRDTMQEAYQFGNLPQGLKALAVRILGRDRPGYNEIVTPAYRNALGAWLLQALWIAESRRTVKERVSAKTGKALKPKIVITPIEKILSHVFKHFSTSEQYDGRAKLIEMVSALPDTQESYRILSECGPMPLKGVALIPLDELVQYGCADADDALTLALKFDQMRQELVEELLVQEHDYDDLTVTR